MRPKVENKFLSFKEARGIARKMGLKNRLAWRKHIGSLDYNKSIPKAPDEFYKEWIDWYDFLGCGRSKKYHVNDHYFKKWSHNMAYILGFWWADGNIGKTNIGSCRFYIVQHIKDKYLLMKMLKEMESNHPIRIRSNDMCCIQIGSKTIYNDIIKMGGKERKSLDCKFPHIPKKYLPDFIRGHFDGDGSIYGGISLKSKISHGYQASVCSGSKKFILQLKKTLEDNISGIHILFYKRIRIGSERDIDGRVLKNDSTIYILSFSPNNLRKLRDFMYSTPSDLKMLRKYKMFVASGDYKICSRDIEYMDFESAKKIIIDKKFNSLHDYRRWIRGDGRDNSLPSNPSSVYKEWNGWKDFLGHYHLPYKELSGLAMQNNIINREQYHKWVKEVRGGIMRKYPHNPQFVYKLEWRGWKNFLGKNQKYV